MTQALFPVPREQAMRRPQTSLRMLAVLAIASALVLMSCDSDDDENTSEFTVLQREDWVVTEFKIEEDLMTDLENRYEGGVLFTFSEDGDTSDRTFEIVADAEGEENDVQVNGDVTIDADNDVLGFSPRSGLGFVLAYQLDGASRVRLVAKANGNGTIVRDLLLPNSNIGGSFPEVRLVLEPAVEQTGR